MKEIALAMLTVAAPFCFILAVIIYLTTFMPEIWYKFKFYVLRYKFKNQKRITIKLQKPC